MSSNKKQFALIAIAGGIFAAVMITGIVANMVRGNYMALPLVFSALLLAVGAIWLGIWLNRRRIQMMFLNPTPDKLIENYHATLLRARARKIPHADAAAAQLSALAATVYGQFDRAREELAAVDWEKTPAIYRGHRLDVLALIALLEKQDRARTLELLAEARTLRQSDPLGSVPVLHDAILVAVGAGDAESVTRTQRGAGRKLGALPAVCAWALSLHAGSTGQTADATRYLAQARAAAPYFVGLTE